MKRVVITGVGMLTPLGNSLSTVMGALRRGKSGITIRDEWNDIVRLRTRAAGVCKVAFPDHYDYKATRSMGRVAQLATYASELALGDAGLLTDGAAFTTVRDLDRGSIGVAYGSCTGSTEAFGHFAQLVTNRSTAGIAGTTYLKLMSHTTAAHVALSFGLTGRVIPCSSACTSASQAIGFGFEAIQAGKQRMMIAGGAEELAPGIAAIFDVLGAATHKKSGTPAPFDVSRDGLAVAEGACSVILEERESALARGAVPYAEIVGFSTTADGKHLVHSNPEQMQKTMQFALDSAGIPADAVGYVNAHATGTLLGDRAESSATSAVFGNLTPVSSLKGHFGHTLGACGSIEVILSAAMMNEGFLVPTLHLSTLDPECSDLRYLTGGIQKAETEYALSNNFAFGGVNTSLVIRRPADARRSA